MKHLFSLFILFFLPLVLFASNDSLTKQKGTTQEIISSLTPLPASENVSSDTPLETLLTIPLDSTHLKKFDVTLTCLSCEHNAKIEGEITLGSDNKKVIFSPHTSLGSGLYEIAYKSLKVDKKYKDTHINEIKYRFSIGDTDTNLRLFTLMEATSTDECVEGSRVIQGSGDPLLQGCTPAPIPLVKQSCPANQQLKQGTVDECIAGLLDLPFETYIASSVCPLGMVNIQGGLGCRYPRVVLSLPNPPSDDWVWGTLLSFMMQSALLEGYLKR